MALALAIGGVARDYVRGSFYLSEVANGRSTLSFDLIAADSTGIPALDAEVIVTDGATRLFGGAVDRPTTRGVDKGSRPELSITVSAVDCNSYAKRRYVNETIPAGTLKAALTILTTYLAGYGTTLHASQVNGPSLPEIVCNYTPLEEVLNQIMTMTAEAGEPYTWRIDHFNVLRAFQPSTVTAPFNVTGATNIAKLFDNVEVEISREHYANRIIIIVPPKTELGRTESFTGDGTAGPFSLLYTPTKLYGHILLQSGGGETLGIPPDSPIQWSYDPITNSITREAGATTVGETYILFFDGVYNGLGIAEDAAEIAAHGIRERVLTIDTVPTDTTAQALAEGQLAISIQPFKTVRYATWISGFAPGQQQVITLPKYAIDDTAVIAEVVSRDVEDLIERRITAAVDAAQTNLGRGWRDVYKIWAGDKFGTGGASAVVAPGTTSSGGPSPPFTSVQFNRSGSFGGAEEFTYDETTHSLICGGGGSSITAATPESCQVFGYNNHITD